MHVLWAAVTISVVVALVGAAAWAFVVAPIVVPGRARRRGVRAG